MPADMHFSPAARRFVWSMVIAQWLVQIGAYTLPSLLPAYIDAWHLSKTEAGWIIGIFFAAYVATVPILVALTDVLPTKRVYMVGAGLTAFAHLAFAFFADGFWSAFFLRALAGIGWAGAYMPGLKAVADALEGPAQTRAISMHAAGVGVAGASSFAFAGLISTTFGNTAAFIFGGSCALLALIIAWGAMPKTAPPPKTASDTRSLLDFRPVFRNRAVMAWIVGYTAHLWELAALRAWGVTFLTVAAAQTGAPSWLPAPPILFTIAGFIGITISVFGNEMSLRYGRIRIITLAFSVSAVLCLVTGWTVSTSMLLAAVLAITWNAAIFSDSSALTAGTVMAADPKIRGATMGLHSMFGYAGGFFGPLGVGLALDLAGSNVTLGWGLAFGHVALITIPAFILLRMLAR